MGNSDSDASVCGCLFFDRRIGEDLWRDLMDFHLTRHYVRTGVDEERYGKDGMFYPDPGDSSAPDFRKLYADIGWKSERIPEEITLYSSVAGDLPGLYCHWRPSPDRLGLEHDGDEKDVFPHRWLQVLIDRFVAPAGYLLGGEFSENVYAFGYWGRLTVVVDRNVISGYDLI